VRWRFCRTLRGRGGRSLDQARGLFFWVARRRRHLNDADQVYVVGCPTTGQVAFTSNLGGCLAISSGFGVLVEPCGLARGARCHFGGFSLEHHRIDLGAHSWQGQLPRFFQHPCRDAFALTNETIQQVARWRCSCAPSDVPSFRAMSSRTRLARAKRGFRRPQSPDAPADEFFRLQPGRLELTPMEISKSCGHSPVLRDQASESARANEVVAETGEPLLAEHDDLDGCSVNSLRTLAVPVQSNNLYRVKRCVWIRGRDRQSHCRTGHQRC